jgi:hypothetical protein
MYLIRASGAALVLKGYAAWHLLWRMTIEAQNPADMRRNRQKSFVVIILSAQISGYLANPAHRSLNYRAICDAAQGMWE